MDTRQVKKILSNKHKAFKWSVSTDHHNSYSIDIMSGPLDFGKHEQINHYHYQEQLADLDPKCVELISDILDACQEVRPINYHETGDYGNQPNYYINIRIGKWDRPYQIK